MVVPRVTAILPQDVKMLFINSGFSGAEDVTLILLIKKPPVWINPQRATIKAIGRN